ncbi:hypothetical protein C7212DRAFT_340842 [Tuber magnatum]|uniref:Uncharacterized protein n=1 Tax=Tuber magnatum TaxID=42249 RepID=A0A317T3C4_9PEZI|nr:hypothetical protein C7212DRAFT_340842 [Tuber magnatum]
MKHLLSILLFAVIALAAPVSPKFRLSILYTEGEADGTPSVEYLGLKDGVAVITKDSSQTIIAVTFPSLLSFPLYQEKQRLTRPKYLDPDPRGMLYTDQKIPGYLFPTDDPSVYDFRFGGIPKIAGVLYTEFAFVERICQACFPDKILAYSPPTDGSRYQGQFRAYKVGEDWVVKFHTSKPRSTEGSVGIDLVRQAT